METKAHRGILIHPHEVGEYWSRLFQKSGLEILGIHPVGGTDAELSLCSLLDTVKTAEFRKFIDNVRSASSNVEIEYQFHAMSYLLPRNLFDSHPEYFRVDEKGERNPYFNFCPSCSEALDIVEERAYKLAGLLYGSEKKFYFWTDDVVGGYCRCPKCRELTTSDQALIIYNRILRGLKRYSSNAKHCYLAYVDAIVPPSAIKPEQGIFLQYAPIGRNSSLPLSAPQNSTVLEPLESLLGLFGKSDSTVLEYWIDNSRYCGWKLPYVKLPFEPAIIHEDAKLYSKYGFEVLSSFACYLGSDYADIFGEPPIKEYADALRV